MLKTYTKRQLVDALEDLDDDAPISINIITDVGDGEESGMLFDIEAVALSGTKEGMLVGYN